MSVVVIGLSHRTAPVEIRDGVAVLPQRLQAVLNRIHGLEAVPECAMLSTCNRTEVYLVTDRAEQACAGVVEILSELSEMDADLLKKHLWINIYFQAPQIWALDTFLSLMTLIIVS